METEGGGVRGRGGQRGQERLSTQLPESSRAAIISRIVAKSVVCGMLPLANNSASIKLQTIFYVYIFCSKTDCKNCLGCISKLMLANSIHVFSSLKNIGLVNNII